MMLEVPPPLPRWQSILFPFTKWVWTAVLISTLCSTVTYHLLTCKRHLSLTRNSLTIFQSLLSYPLDHVPALWRLRNFLLFWWVVTWFVNTIYRSNLIAVLTVPVFPTKIQTAEGLANSKYRLCMLDYGEFVDEALAESTHPVLSRLSKVLDMVPIIDDIEYTGEEQCIELVLAGTHAHIETYSYVKILYSMLGHGAQVYSLREQLYPGHLAFMVKKNTPWKYKFDTGMQWMFETGLIQKWHKDAMDEFRGYLETKPAPELVPLSLAHLQGPFLIYILSILLAILVLLWEILYHPRKKKTLSKKREISKY
ncbi:uncharacterized protein LOC135205033 [Macrobrachium nipponense]|uniref:uncharacterized protein LOC135205033 n=1 Tax=Macrobrachium nipponense TaxID=159736 RepID=UPI0030C81C54